MPEPGAQVAAAIKAIYQRMALPLAVQVRDMLREVFPDEGFVAASGTQGRPGYSSRRLALVRVNLRFQWAVRQRD